MVSNLMHSGQMLHWCSRHNYLVLADIWGQSYIRFEENEPVTTTVVPDTTTEVKILLKSSKIDILFTIRVRREGDARQTQQLRLMPQQQKRPSQPQRYQQQQRSHSRTPCTTWWSRVWVITIAVSRMINDKHFAFRVLCTSSDLIWRSKAPTLLSFQFMTR